GAGPNLDDYGRLVEVATGRPFGHWLNRGAGEPWRHDSGLVRPLIVDGPTFSPDGTLLTTCIRAADDGREQFTRVWDAATGQPKTPSLRFPMFVHAFVFSPDRRTLATGHG